MELQERSEMQTGGTLKKRKRRAIAKVTGLGTVPYDENDDNFDARTIFSDKSPNDQPNHFKINTGPDTRIRMSYLHELGDHQLTKSGKRATRDPAFHLEEGENEEDEDEQARPPNIPTYIPMKTREEYIKDRPYFLDKTTMTRLKQILILGMFSGTFPWKWNSKTHRIDKWSPTFEKLWNFQWFFVTIQTALLTGFQFYSFISRLETDIKTYREVFMNSVSVYWYVCAVYFNINMYTYKDQCLFTDKYLLHLDDYDDGGRIVINLSIPSNTSQVFASVALFLVIPYQPWYLFSYIYPKPWYCLIPGAIQEFVVVGQVIIAVLHNHNDSGYTREELRNPKTAVETYRTLQILCTCFNDCMSPLAIPLMKTHILTGLIPCGYVFIRSMNHKFIEEFPGILTYPICVIDCATAGFTTLSLAAEVFDLACGFVDSWSRTRQKDFRRILMSCPVLKVKVGRFYYVTVSTTITFFKVATDYIIDCIITFP
ncbi:Glucose 1,6-bisphosphate synthase [Orchesella cincta]|uniref:Glucose 1,6-bisphosphate synthase n=1 Tax=Orchesella cincta TaxID=48709 RepID=A0A1D2MAT7_ORCCI|nr:Glucose 1,6-bisphosphate synthase [Orchesella cincta]